jgi:hypothetical protein
MVQFNIEAGHLKKVHTNEQVITVPESVEVIDKVAFYGLPSVCIINLPNSLREINEFGIANCPALDTISVYPTGEINLTGTIHTGAIMNCDNLKSIKIPEGVSFIEEKAIFINGNLNSITFSKNLKKINTGFLQQATPAQVVLPPSVEEISYSKTSTKLYLNNDYYTSQNGALYTSAGEIINANEDEIKLTDSIKSIHEGCLRNHSCKITGTSKYLTASNGAIIKDNKIVDYYGNNLTVDRDILPMKVILDELIITKAIDLSNVTGKARTLRIESGVELDENALAGLEVKYISYKDIEINIKTLNMVAKELFLPQDSKTYYKVLTVLKFRELDDETLKFWLAYSEQYSYSMYLELSKILLANMRKTIEECGEDTSALDAIEERLLGAR